MFPRLAPVAVSLALLVVAACGASAAPTRPSVAAVPTAVPTVGPLPAIDPDPQPVVTASPDAGNVGGDGAGPELTIELVDEDTIGATISDPAAKAWRLVVAGIGERAGDRWEILVETGDTGPDILATEIRDGRIVDEMDLSGFADGTAAAGGCHGTLPVCLASDGFRLPQDGDGTFSVRLVLPEPGTPLTITGGTATWPGEPFILGPWTDTEPFPWNAAG
ncbi:MAG: hypothetical protein MUQ32_00645 [Chloroflexi bacterium]|nr:hypothetical protein [Chloroflexota bacterium]